MQAVCTPAAWPAWQTALSYRMGAPQEQRKTALKSTSFMHSVMELCIFPGLQEPRTVHGMEWHKTGWCRALLNGTGSAEAATKCAASRDTKRSSK